MLENFSDDFERILANSAKPFYEKKQKRLTVAHICYGIFSDSKFSKLSSKFLDTENLVKDLYIKLSQDDEQVNLEHPEVSIDLSLEARNIIYRCVINSKKMENKTINTFDFLEFMLIYGSLPDICEKYKIDNVFINKVRRLQDRQNKPKRTLVKNKILKKNEFLSETTPTEDKHGLSGFITNISEKVKSNKNLIMQRKNLTDELISVLLRKEKSNPLIIGEPGIGKTTVVENLAQLINNNDVPDLLKNKQIYEVNLTALLSGTNFRGDFEKRFENLMSFVKLNKNAIIFIDEIHCMKGLGSTGASKNELDFSNMIKPYLSSGEISCIGSTTLEEYKNSIENDKALDRRFKAIHMKEPNEEETVSILNYKKKDYEMYHGLKIKNDLIPVIVSFAQRYITNKRFPDKAFDLLDIACSLTVIQQEKILSHENVIKAVSNVTGIEPSQIMGFNKNILELESHLKTKIFGQNEAITRVVDKIIVSKSGLNNPLKPLASFLMIGPTGVGKTELVNEISKSLNMNFIRFDMSEYSAKGSASKLIGTSAGYIGYEEGGKLTEFVNHNPYAIILFDEIEKADSSVYNLFLQILDYGKISDGSGKEIDFRNTMIFMTSNSGAEAMDKNNIGFVEESGKSLSNMENIVNKAFSPEFRNRISKIIYFNKLEKDTMVFLVNKSIEILLEKTNKKGINIQFSDSAINEIINKGFDSKMGARPLERFIEDNISILIAKNILNDFFKPKSLYEIDFKDKNWDIKKI